MIDQLLASALGPLVASRAWPNRFAQPEDARAPRWPAIRWQLVSADPGGSLCGTTDEDTDQGRVQIDIVAEDFDDMKSLKRQVIAALSNTDPPCTRQPGGFETFDQETKTHRAVVDFLFHPSTLPESPA